MAAEPRTLNFDDFADELLAEKQPRALVILACAKIDVQLLGLITPSLLPKIAKANEQDELLEGDNPLATFSSRIKICRRLGLIDEPLAKTLDKLRNVRNQAAHWVLFGVKDPPLRDQLKHLLSLVESRRSYNLTVKKFFGDVDLTAEEKLKATLLTISAILESIAAKIAASPPSMAKPFKID